MSDLKSAENKKIKLRAFLGAVGALLSLYARARQRVEERHMNDEATRIQMCVRRWLLHRKITLKRERSELYTASLNVDAPKKERTKKEMAADAVAIEVQKVNRATNILKYHPLFGKVTTVINDVSFFGKETVIGEYHLFEAMTVGGTLIMQLQDQSRGNRTRVGVCYLGHRKHKHTIRPNPQSATSLPEPVDKSWYIIFVGLTRLECRSGRVVTTEVPPNTVTCPNGNNLVRSDMKKVIQDELGSFLLAKKAKTKEKVTSKSSAKSVQQPSERPETPRSPAADDSADDSTESDNEKKPKVKEKKPKVKRRSLTMYALIKVSNRNCQVPFGNVLDVSARYGNSLDHTKHGLLVGIHAWGSLLNMLSRKRRPPQALTMKLPSVCLNPKSLNRTYPHLLRVQEGDPARRKPLRRNQVAMKCQVLIPTVLQSGQGASDTVWI